MISPYFTINNLRHNCLFYVKAVQTNSGGVQKMVRFKSPAGRRDKEKDGEGDENGLLSEQNYVQALGAEG